MHIDAFLEKIDWIARAVFAEQQVAELSAEVTRLRNELDTARDLLRTVPVPDYRSEYEQWRGNVEDYLETI